MKKIDDRSKGTAGPVHGAVAIAHPARTLRHASEVARFSVNDTTWVISAGTAGDGSVRDCYRCQTDAPRSRSAPESSSSDPTPTFEGDDR